MIQVYFIMWFVVDKYPSLNWHCNFPTPPEYQWIDKIRTPRASNEARQTLFSQLSGEVRRKIGLKVLELGGNAVVG